MKNLNAMFQMVLADYTLDQVRSAFAFYLKNNSELPAPADICNIIERGGKPPLEKAVYVSICKKDGCSRSDDDWAYIKEYEHFALTGEHKTFDHPNPTKYRNVKILGGPANG
jgi:hypothetical protein